MKQIWMKSDGGTETKEVHNANVIAITIAKVQILKILFCHKNVEAQFQFLLS